MLRSQQGTFPVPVCRELTGGVEVGYREQIQSITMLEASAVRERPSGFGRPGSGKGGPEAMFEEGILKEVLFSFFQGPLQGGTVCSEPQHFLPMADVSYSRILVLPPGCPTPAQDLGSGRAGLLQLPSSHCDILSGSSFLSPLT